MYRILEIECVVGRRTYVYMKVSRGSGVTNVVHI